MMKVTTISEVRSHVAAARREGKIIGFVPTMGALHAGHGSLVAAARGACGYVVVSIFVNPTQFGPNEDFAKYPRTEAADLALCEKHGADLAFLPDVAEMYPPGTLTTVSVSKLGEGLCGQSRPGHFTGVCTVVNKLLNIVLPDEAFFGAKDYQQAAIIRRMTADLDFPVRIKVCATVREPDGLAMSSRNAYLSPTERAQAPALYRTLQRARDLVHQGQSPAEMIAVLREKLAAEAPLGAVDYIEIIDPDTLAAVNRVQKPVVVALAVRFPSARLIDNIRVD